MGKSYQNYNTLVQSNTAIAERKKHAEKIARMKAEGTYCDPVDPDLSFLNYKMTTCKTCPNAEWCEREVEKRSQEILKYRRKSIKKSKTKRAKKKGCGCK